MHALPGRQPLGSQNTPFSLASVDTNGTNPVVSEALAVQMYPHQNSSLLMIDHSTKPSESPDETQSEAEEDLDVPMPTDSSEDVPTTPPQPKFSLDDVDSPLRNPRAPPEPPNYPPVINFIPATPWLAAIAWWAYLVPVMFFYLRKTASPPRAAKTEQERRWLVENADAIRRENASIERDGLPLAKYRLF